MEHVAPKLARRRDVSRSLDELVVSIEDYEVLSQAFKRFSEASMQLQSKYEQLRGESQQLRLELQRKEEEVKKSERLATLGKTAAALAHEIRNPLGAMTLYTSLLREDLQSQPEQQELVDAIDRSISTLNHVVSNILHFTKNNAPVRVPVSLTAILAELCGQCTQMYPKSRLVLKQRSQGFVMADETRMRQLFTNLIMNGLQAQSYQGTVVVLVVERADSVYVRIRDQGAGIPFESIESIFEPFTTTKPEGTGLGLAICRQITDLHQAEIVAANRLDGAQFTVTFFK